MLRHPIFNNPVIDSLAHFALKYKQRFFVVLICLLFLYVFLSLLSYNALDPAWSHYALNSEQRAVSNIGGALGAYSADWLHHFFGVGAWLCLFWLGIEAVMQHYAHPRMILPLRLMAYGFLWISASVLLYGFGLWRKLDALSVGGIVGFEFYHALTGALGALALIGVALFFVVVLFLLFDFKTLKKRLNREKTSPSERYGDSELSPIQLPKPELSPRHADYPAGSLLNNFLQSSGIKESLLASDEKNLVSETGDGAPSATIQSATIERATIHAKTVNQTIIYQQTDSHKEQTTPSQTVPNPVSGAHHQNAGVDDNFVPTTRTSLSTEALLYPELQNQTVDGAPKPKDSLPPHKEMPVNAIQSQAPLTRIQDDKDPEGREDGKLPFEGIALTALTKATLTPSALSSTTEKVAALETIAPTSAQVSTASSVALAEPSLSDGLTIVDDEPAALMLDGTDDASSAKQESAPFEAFSIPSSHDEHSDKNQAGDEIFAINIESSRLALASDAPSQALDASLETLAPEFGLARELTLDAEHTTDRQMDVQAHNTQVNNDQAYYDQAPTQSEILYDDKSALQGVDQAPQKPDILDDTAFLGKSLAMQTAAYRATLSPLPSLEILDAPVAKQPSYSPEELTRLSELLEIKLKEFGVNAKVMNVMQGPVVTNFEVELAAGVKASKVTGISQDLARSLSMPSLRVVEVIAGKPYIGIEIPNKHKQIVKLIELLNNPAYHDNELQIAMAMGKDIGGDVVITDLAKAPHMLVAGTTGSGKSVLVNAMLLSMLLRYKPDELRLILIDPKMLELAPYADIPHLLTPVVTDMTEAASALSWCVGEMERRYLLMSLLKVRKISEFNKKVNEAAKNNTPIYDPLWQINDSATRDKPPALKPLPLIVVVADEFADMMMQVGKQAEELIARLAQKSRAAGIHLMLATQRPSVDVVTGLIKANIPSRAALRVNSKVDSRTILDSGGAEDMLGHGDMLFLAPGKNEPIRVHGAYVSDEEVNRVTDAWRERGAPDYIDTVTSALNFPDDAKKANKDGLDELYDEAFSFVVESGKTSISALQRHLKIGYNRSANIIESMQEQGILSPPDQSGKRTLLL